MKKIFTIVYIWTKKCLCIESITLYSYLIHKLNLLSNMSKYIYYICLLKDLNLKAPGCITEWLRCIVGHEFLLCLCLYKTLKLSCLILQREQDSWIAVMTWTKTAAASLLSTAPRFLFKPSVSKKRADLCLHHYEWDQCGLKSSKEKRLFVYINSLAVSVPMGSFFLPIHLPFFSRKY